MDKGINVTIRLPRQLLGQVRAYAKGDETRPRASFNAAVVYLLGRGLAATGWPAGGDAGEEEEEEEEEEKE